MAKGMAELANSRARDRGHLRQHLLKAFQDDGVVLDN
jgi:hypothetical protein